MSTVKPLTSNVSCADRPGIRVEMQTTEGELASNRKEASDGDVTEKTNVDPGLASPKPSLIPLEQEEVPQSQEIPKIAATILPSMPTSISSTPTVVGANLKIAPNVSNGVVGLLPVVTPTGEPRGKIETADITTTFPLPTPPLTSAVPTKGDNLVDTAISANTTAFGGNNPILPTGGLDSKVQKILPQTRKVNTGVGTPTNNSVRLNKFVRRLHDMLQAEKNSGVVEWRRGLLVLHSTDTFAKRILPKYFDTRNFKTFRRQLNYYGFVHVRSFSAKKATTTALWVNQDLAKRGDKNISSVLMLKRVEPSEGSKTAEGRRVRKEEAVSTVEGIGINTKAPQLEQIRSLALQRPDEDFGNGMLAAGILPNVSHKVPMVVHCHTPLVTTPPSTHLQPKTISNTPATIAPNNDSTDEAANLLLMLSRSLVPS